ncbi:hypothetical protein ACJMK2_031694 [Sinanodonta woodiana]|uniref:Uncharacterized protein n=1 Tax=Sinanodonta woodiana TaxID=1069815 RepID=A0ABD3WZJ2_SINWO
MACDTNVFSPPIASERPLPIVPNDDVHMDQTITSQHSYLDKKMEQLPVANIMCMDGYEMICISSNDDFQKTLHNNQSNAKSQQNYPTSFRNTSGYLSVEFVMKSPVQNN